ncbi:MAG: hypothetical protein WCO00_07710 [Rhodospirillaceae bacterium]
MNTVQYPVSGSPEQPATLAQHRLQSLYPEMMAPLDMADVNGHPGIALTAALVNWDLAPRLQDKEDDYLPDIQPQPMAALTVSEVEALTVH